MTNEAIPIPNIGKHTGMKMEADIIIDFRLVWEVVRVQCYFCFNIERKEDAWHIGEHFLSRIKDNPENTKKETVKAQWHTCRPHGFASMCHTGTSLKKHTLKSSQNLNAKMKYSPNQPKKRRVEQTSAQDKETRCNMKLVVFLNSNDRRYYLSKKSCIHHSGHPKADFKKRKVKKKVWILFINYSSFLNQNKR